MIIQITEVHPSSAWSPENCPDGTDAVGLIIEVPQNGIQKLSNYPGYFEFVNVRDRALVNQYDIKFLGATEIFIYRFKYKRLFK